MSRDDFVRLCKPLAAGTIAIGSAKIRKLATGPIEGLQQAGQVLCDIDESAETLLGKLYDVLHPIKGSGTNGTAVKVEVKR